MEIVLLVVLAVEALAGAYVLVDWWWRRRALRQLMLMLLIRHPMSSQPPTMLVDRGELLS